MGRAWQSRPMALRSWTRRPIAGAREDTVLSHDVAVDLIDEDQLPRDGIGVFLRVLSELPEDEEPELELGRSHQRWSKP